MLFKAAQEVDNDLPQDTKENSKPDAQIENVEGQPDPKPKQPLPHKKKASRPRAAKKYTSSWERMLYDILPKKDPSAEFSDQETSLHSAIKDMQRDGNPDSNTQPVAMPTVDESESTRTDHIRIAFGLKSARPWAGPRPQNAVGNPGDEAPGFPKSPEDKRRWLKADNRPYRWEASSQNLSRPWDAAVDRSRFRTDFASLKPQTPKQTRAKKRISESGIDPLPAGSPGFKRRRSAPTRCPPEQGRADIGTSNRHSLTEQPKGDSS